MLMSVNRGMRKRTLTKKSDTEPDPQLGKRPRSQKGIQRTRSFIIRKEGTEGWARRAKEQGNGEELPGSSNLYRIHHTRRSKTPLYQGRVHSEKGESVPLAGRKESEKIGLLILGGGNKRSLEGGGGGEGT